MSLSNQVNETRRLRDLFEVEASKFHDTRLRTLLVSQSEVLSGRGFASPHHTIMLWQYYGAVGSEDVEILFANVQDSDWKWGLKDAALSSFAIVEGGACELFVRMAKRAGGLFNKAEALTIKCHVQDEIMQGEQSKHHTAKPVSVTNDNPLAIWINYLLFHLSRTHPGRERAQRIEPDPFSLSLLALDRLADDQVTGKVDRSSRNIADIDFKVALSFPGERRPYVAKIARVLREALGPDTVFYDHDYQAQLARPNMDTLLQDIYRNRSDLVVIFLCAEYAQKEWCGLEWRAIRDIIRTKQDERIMFVRFDDSAVDGVFPIDGYVDARTCEAGQVARYINERLQQCRKVVEDA